MTKLQKQKQAIFQRIYDKMYCEELAATDYDTAQAEERADARLISAFAVFDSYRATDEQS